MGAGKTTTGRKLARKLDYRFTDLDARIEEVEKMPVAEIFRLKGEAWFRDKETAMLRSFAGDDRVVISTGGGAPCFHDNMEWMKNHGITVYLRMTPESLYYRLNHARSKRPLILGKTGNSLRLYIDDMLKIREPFYMKANIIADGKNTDIEKLAELIFPPGLQGRSGF